MTFLRIPTSVSTAADRPASYGNQITSILGLAAKYRSRRWMWSTADHQMFTTLTGKLSLQRLRRSPVDFYSNKCLANAKRPCDCRVQLCALYFRHDVIWLSWQCVPSALNVNVKKFKKARVNGESNYNTLKDSHKCPRCCWQTSIIW